MRNASSGPNIAAGRMKGAVATAVRRQLAFAARRKTRLVQDSLGSRPTWLRPLPAAPREEHGREICRIAPFPWWTVMLLWRMRVRLQHLPIKMPSRMTEDWQNDCETEEQRQRTDHEQRGDNQPPCGDGEWISHHDAERRMDCVCPARMPVEHQWKRHNANAQGHDGEQEADAAADDDQRPSLRRGQHEP